ncbi:hypothetical protein QAD02_007784 [Eretmocerus hayati]|uniref:Uncharacterized protein n=1 Tax=Eretmocerus hayati TaxID=131215 RepID=A0ACC2N4N3_9HYME|nr:hypothetical protein QAD02_007784 [Eretmocerus hayati]
MIFKLFQNKPEMIPLVESFNVADTPESVLYENGMRIIAKLYDAECSSYDLDEMRYTLLRKKTTKTSFQLEQLPPTKEAAMQHSLRAYLQVQLWLGNEKITATDYG